MSTQDNSSARVTAVVVSHNSAAVLGGCLAALKVAGIPAIVVDNASTDNSVDIAKAEGAVVMPLQENIGFGKGMNAGTQYAQAEFCLLINPDATVNGNTVPALLQVADAQPNAVIISPQIVEPDGRVFTLNGSLLTPPSTPSALFVSGACMLVRRDWFEAMGGFDPNIFLFYEDDDLCRRAWDSGREVVAALQAEVLHLRGKSSPSSFNHTYVVRYHQAWSRRYVCRKYGLPNPRLKLIVISNLKLTFAVLTFRKQRIARYLGSLMGNLS